MSRISLERYENWKARRASTEARLHEYCQKTGARLVITEEQLYECYVAHNGLHDELANIAKTLHGIYAYRWEERRKGRVVVRITGQENYHRLHPHATIPVEKQWLTDVRSVLKTLASLDADVNKNPYLSAFHHCKTHNPTRWDVNSRIWEELTDEEFQLFRVMRLKAEEIEGPSALKYVRQPFLFLRNSLCI